MPTVSRIPVPSAATPSSHMSGYGVQRSSVNQSSIGMKKQSTRVPMYAHAGGKRAPFVSNYASSLPAPPKSMHIPSTDEDGSTVSVPAPQTTVRSTRTIPGVASRRAVAASRAAVQKARQTNSSVPSETQTQSQSEDETEHNDDAIDQEYPSKSKSPKVWSIQDFQIGRLLGKGKFGQVFLAREKTSKTLVALKVLVKDQLIANGLAGQLRKEMEIHSRIRHDNILPLYATFQDASRVYLVLKVAQGGDLYKKMRSYPSRRLSDRETALYISQLVSALEACHSQGVIHRDIKPENLLLSESGDILLADFGWSSANVTKQNRRETLCGTLYYLAPEMVRGDKYDASVDIWAIGIIMYELLAGQPPFIGSGEDETMDRIAEGRLQIPPHITLAARDLIQRILQKDPAQRPSLEEIKAHRWLAHRRFK